MAHSAERTPGQIIPREKLMPLLGEFLAAQTSAARLYRRAIDRAESQTLRQEMGEQLAHLEMEAGELARVANDLGQEAPVPHPSGLNSSGLNSSGLNPTALHPGVQRIEERTRAFEAAAEPALSGQAANVEQLFLSEASLIFYWDVLAQAATLIHDAPARDRLRSFVSTYLEGSRERMRWARRTLEKLLLESLTQPATGFFEDTREIAAGSPQAGVA